jgi:hypothetical protein
MGKEKYNADYITSTIMYVTEVEDDEMLITRRKLSFINLGNFHNQGR